MSLDRIEPSKVAGHGLGDQDSISVWATKSKPAMEIQPASHPMGIGGSLPASNATEHEDNH
jgi:hypothetical protein